MYSPKVPSKSKKMAKKTQKMNTSPSQKQNPRQMASRKRKPASLAKKRRRKLKWGRLGLVLLVALGLGYVVAWFIRSGVPQLLNSIEGDWRQITAKSTPLPFSQPTYQSLSKQLESYLSKQKGVYGVYGIDLITGAHFGQNENQLFTSSNTSDLPVIMNLYSDIANHHMSPGTLVHYKPVDKEAGSGFIAGMPFGTAFTVIQLAHASIAQNDVVARNMLIRKLGTNQINHFLEGIGVHQPFNRPFVTTPQDLSLEMAYLFHMYQKHPQSIMPLIGLLEGNANQGRIASGFSPHINIAQITANWPNEYHDTALVFYPKHPLAISICSDGTTASEATQVEMQAAKLVAQFLQNGGRG